MSTTDLMRKLIAIEQSIGVATHYELRNRLQEAQEYLLAMQREAAESARIEVSWGPARRMEVARQDAWDLRKRIAS